MAETNSLLNCRTGYCTGGSNPPLSAKLMKVVKRSDFFPVFLFYRVRADSVDEGSIGKLGDSVSKSVLIPVLLFLYWELQKWIIM